jgi:DNA-directed RNA polymerase specialized sigma24 family protein
MSNEAKEDSRCLNQIGQTASFHTTSWKMVLKAGQPDSAEAGPALELLCRIYWKPLFVFARAKGRSPHDAEDATQGFFEHLLSNFAIAHADPKKGKFRNFLLASFKHFLDQEWNRNKAQKRGGLFTFVSLDEFTGADSLLPDTARSESPESLYERRYAIALFETVLQRLESEHRSADQSAKFAALKPFITCENDKVPAAVLGAQLGVSEGTARVAVYRLRRRYWEILQQEVLRTVEEPADVEEELRHIRRVLSS